MERRGGGSGGLERGELGEVVTDEQGNQIVFRKIEVIRIFKFLHFEFSAHTHKFKRLFCVENNSVLEELFKIFISILTFS